MSAAATPPMPRRRNISWTPSTDDLALAMALKRGFHAERGGVSGYLAALVRADAERSTAAPASSPSDELALLIRRREMLATALRVAESAAHICTAIMAGVFPDGAGADPAKAARIAAQSARIAEMAIKEAGR